MYTDKYNIIKEIGYGYLGTVYLVEDKYNNKYAMKIEKMFEIEINKSLKYRLWREIEFSNKMYKKYPCHFMKIYDYYIDKKCNYILDLNKNGLKLELLNNFEKKYYQDLFNSLYCSIKIYTLVDITLKDLYEQNKLNDNEIYDLFIQLLYVIYLCKKNKYIHTDLNMGNIGLIKTSNKNINIFNKKVNTHGYIIVLLDYGNIINKKYILFNFKDFENKYHINTNNKVEINNKIKKYIKKYLPIKYDIKINNDILSQSIYKIIFYKHFENKLLNDNNLLNNNNNYIKPKLLLPLNVIIYLIKNIYNIKKCILYLINNSNNINS